MSILTPPLATQSLYRYTIMAIPLSCLAVGLGFATRNRARRPEAEPPGAATRLAVITAAGAGRAARPTDEDR